MRNLLADLGAITGPRHVLAEPDVVAGYATDWTRRYAGRAACVVLPGSTSQVSDIVRACAAHGARIIPQGGNTGLVGGSIPSPSDDAPQVILSTRRLTSLGPADRAAAQITAGAGVTIAQLDGRAASAGLRYGVDLASRDSATVGGTIATNAGGIHTIRYGPTRSQIAGITAVLADGSVVGNLSGLTASGSGYDIAHLLIGSEGTLGVITEARLLLRPPEPPAAVMFCGTAGIAEAADLTGQLKAAVPGLLAAEYVDAAGLTLVREVFGLPAPLPSAYPGNLLVEIAGPPGPQDAPDYLAELTAPLSLPGDTVLVQDARGMAALWEYRERLTEAIATAGIAHKIDVAVPVSELGSFCAELDSAVGAAARPNGAGAGGAGPESAPAVSPRVIVFGHIAVGNLHVNVLGPDPADVRADQAVARLAAAHGGTVAAEHGVGRAKNDWLAWSKSPAEIAVMRAIKKALDPAGLLNPGVLLPHAPS